MSALGADLMNVYRAHPAQFVREQFGIEPDLWQLDVLEDFPHHPRQAMACCKGPGKTAVKAWLAWNFLSTRQHPKIGAVSISGDNLRDNLWAEMAKWRNKSPFLKHQFEWTATRIFLKESPETWFMSARQWRQNADAEAQGQALAGLWADNVMFVIDEAGGVPIPVMRTAEAMLANAYQQGREAHLLLGGNTTSREGALFDAVINQRDLWKCYEITADPDDPKRTPRISAEYAKDQIERYGREDPWVMINILAQFPQRGLNTFISEQDVIEAQRRHYAQELYADWPLILGVDVARFGDDETVFFPRRGKIAYPPLRMRMQDSVQVASHLSNMSNERKADSVQIDTTGGLGGAIYDFYKTSQMNGLPVEFGSRARDEKRFKNKRAEMCWDMMQAIKEGLALPPVPEMVKGLSCMQYTHTLKGQLQVEEKDQIKVRIGRSPDLEDALMCSYAHPVYPAAKNVLGGPAHLSTYLTHNTGSYDPWERYRREMEREHG